jgi:hypothetical protein
MKTVRLIVTGEMEKAALGESLAQLFPSDVVRFDVQKVQGFTSSTLPASPLLRTKRDATAEVFAIANALVAAFEAPRKPGSTVADFAFAVDDLELANAHQRAVVEDTLRAALKAVLAQKTSSMTAQERWATKLQKLASFHLLVPMAESYLFGERGAIVRAGGTPEFELKKTDVEDFEADDPVWTGNVRHPKEYLRELVRRKDPATMYRETGGGANALRTLAWQTVVQNNGPAASFCALVEDLADALGVPSPLGGTPHVNTGSVLRNI